MCVCVCVCVCVYVVKQNAETSKNEKEPQTNSLGIGNLLQPQLVDDLLHSVLLHGRCHGVWQAQQRGQGDCLAHGELGEENVLLLDVVCGCVCVRERERERGNNNLRRRMVCESETKLRKEERKDKQRET